MNSIGGKSGGRSSQSLPGNAQTLAIIAIVLSVLGVVGNGIFLLTANGKDPAVSHSMFAAFIAIIIAVYQLYGGYKSLKLDPEGRKSLVRISVLQFAVCFIGLMWVCVWIFPDFSNGRGAGPDIFIAVVLLILLVYYFAVAYVFMQAPLKAIFEANDPDNVVEIIETRVDTRPASNVLDYQDTSRLPSDLEIDEPEMEQPHLRGLASAFTGMAIILALKEMLSIAFLPGYFTDAGPVMNAIHSDPMLLSVILIGFVLDILVGTLLLVSAVMSQRLSRKGPSMFIAASKTQLALSAARLITTIFLTLPKLSQIRLHDPELQSKISVTQIGLVFDLISLPVLAIAIHVFKDPKTKTQFKVRSNP